MSANEEIQLELDYDVELLQRARKGILGFTLATKEDYHVGWHHKVLAKKLNAFVRGEIQYLMVFMPPRHGKSELVSRRLPPYIHGLYPDDEIMAVSYLDSLAGDMTTDVQNIMDTDVYKAIFPDTRIHPPHTIYSKGTRNSSEHTIIGRRGVYRGNGVGGSFTGKGANWIIIDDPIKGREIADSVTYRERLWAFYNDDLLTRLETSLKDGRKGQVLITQTRWHEDDLSGRILSQMKTSPKARKFEVVHFPAIKVNDDNPEDTRAIGEPLWPEKFNIQQLEEIRAGATSRGWSAVYQQDPVPDGGGQFVEAMFSVAPIPKKLDYYFITVDTAYKDGEDNDYHVFSHWGVGNSSKPELYLIDCFRKHLKASESEEPLRAFIKNSMKYGFRGAYIEPKGHGIYLNDKLKNDFPWPRPDELDEFFKDRRLNKVERANNITPYLGNRVIYINENIVIKDDLIKEALQFPHGTHDDFVDTLVDAVKLTFARKLGTLDVI